MEKPIFNNDFDILLKNEIQKEYFNNILNFLDEEYKTKTIFPPKENIFNALKYTRYKDCKVLILGQDPYHGKGQANGLSFSVNDGIAIPPSLRNIFKELNQDLGIPISKSGDLTKWAKQGVLLLNATLTVEEGKANSHSNIGWQTFTDSVISILNKKTIPMVFILWGAYAQKKIELITNPIHKIITSVHPSPLSANRGFFGSAPFSQTNTFLKANDIREIDWSL